MDVARSISATATGTLDSGAGMLFGASLCGGADAATATVRTGGAGGAVLFELGVGAGLSASIPLLAPLDYSNLHVTITGTTPQFNAFV